MILQVYFTEKKGYVCLQLLFIIAYSEMCISIMNEM